MTAPVCFTCAHEMQSKRIGIVVRYAEDVYRSGDVWECPRCHAMTVANFGDSFDSAARVDIDLLAPYSEEFHMMKPCQCADCRAARRKTKRGE